MTAMVVPHVDTFLHLRESTGLSRGGGETDEKISWLGELSMKGVQICGET